jgi:predicted RNA methylase
VLRDRAKRYLLPRGSAMRRIPLGLGRGIRLETDFAQHTQRHLGLYERPLASHIRRFCRPGVRCWDVGAGDGYYALIFAKLTGAAVLAVEADPALCRKLEDVCEANGAAVEVRQGIVGLDLSLDGLRDSRVGLLKIDIEGAELEALNGAAEILERDGPKIIVETHSAELETGCSELLRRAGYDVTIVDHRRWLREERPIEHNRWIVAETRTATT